MNTTQKPSPCCTSKLMLSSTRLVARHAIALGAQGDAGAYIPESNN